MNVIFTCGGTGGHINPAIAVANLIRQRRPESNILFVGAEDGMETRLVPDAGYALETLKISNFQRRLTPAGLWHNVMTAAHIAGSLRKAGRLQTSSLTGEDGQDVSLPDSRGDPHRALEQAELRRAVRDGVDALPAEFRQALVLRDINGLSYEEIAQVTGLEPGTVKSRIFRARRRLAAYLQADGNFFGPDASYSTTERGGGSHERL